MPSLLLAFSVLGILVLAVYSTIAAFDAGNVALGVLFGWMWGAVACAGAWLWTL